MNLKSFFRPSKITTTILAVLPIFALLVWFYLFANNFSCPDPQDCYSAFVLLIILEYFIKISLLIYIYLAIALILYLQRRSKKKSKVP